MYISKQWLSEFVPIPPRVTAKELALRLTMSTAEVEGYVDQRERFSGVVVGEILSVRKHPNADKLQLAEVTIGSEQLHIVCGAPNIAPGQKVPVATVGTTLPNGMIIEERAVRGEVSRGMLCALDELGLGTDHAGIFILPATVKPGTPFADALGLDDVLYEIDNKSVNHRPDLWGHYGMAREVAVLYKKPLIPLTKLIKKQKTGVGKLVVRVDNPKLCSRYTGVVIEGVVVTKSPDWLRRRIEAMGTKSINTIVDITNYVMFELGQPMHAFDATTLIDRSLTVRLAKQGERIRALDDQEYDLDPETLVIADQKNPIAIAGIIGGAKTGISDQTHTIVLESAHFDHVSVRKTSQRLGIRTESSMRFEKALDPEMAEWALYRAINLIMRVCPTARVVTRVTDIRRKNKIAKPLVLTHEMIWSHIGERIPIKTVIDILKRLGFGVISKKNTLRITIPSWRATKDITMSNDIIEEIARVYGYDNLTPLLPTTTLGVPVIDRVQQLTRRMRTLLAYGFDLTEAYTYSFIGERQARIFGDDPAKHVRITNPIDRDLNLLRRSLAPNLFAAVRANHRLVDRVALFEIGSTFVPEGVGQRVRDGKSETLPAQHKHLGIIIDEKGSEQPFYIVKNIVQNVLRQERRAVQIVPSETIVPWADQNRQAAILVQGVGVGFIAEASDEVRRTHKIDRPIAYAEINLTMLAELEIPEHRYSPIPKYPSITLDASVVLPATVLWSSIRESVIGLDPLIRSIDLFDVYEGAGVPPGKKSIAFHVEYRSDDMTLELRVVEAVHQRIISELERRFGATIRTS